jgi:predicted dehydrogenase
MCVHNWKYSPAFRRAEELISAGRVGQIQYISLVRMRPGPAGNSTNATTGDPWRLDSESGGGILIDHGWHAFYLVQWLLGGVEPLAISSYLRFAPETNIDEFVDLRIEFPGGRLVNVLLTWCGPVRRTTTIIAGTTGLIEMEGEKILLTEQGGRSTQCFVDDTPDDSYHAPWFETVAADYQRALTEGPQSELARVNLREATMALTLTEAARRSAAEGGRAIRVKAS